MLVLPSFSLKLSFYTLLSRFRLLRKRFRSLLRTLDSTNEIFFTFYLNRCKGMCKPVAPQKFFKIIWVSEIGDFRTSTNFFELYFCGTTFLRII